MSNDVAKHYPSTLFLSLPKNDMFAHLLLALLQRLVHTVAPPVSFRQKFPCANLTLQRRRQKSPNVQLFFFFHGQVFHTPPGIQFVWWRLQPGCFCRARHVRTQDGSARRATDGAFRQRGVLALILGGRCWATPLEKKARRNKVSVQRRFTGGWQWCAACRFSSEEQLMSKLGCSFVGFLPTHLS